MGIRAGFQITINAADATKIDIQPGEGYTGGFFKSENLRGESSGERISTLSESTSGDYYNGTVIQGIGLADYTSGVKNYVSLVYTESESTPLAERYYPFTSHNTIISESYTTEVVTESTWQAYTADELENRILIGIVEAQGAGVALSLSNITQLVQPKHHPTVGTQPSSITGVLITGVSSETLIGSGTLRFEASTKKLYWTSPGDAEGTGIPISSSGTFTVYSDDTSYWIQVHVTYASLPVVDATETIAIHSLYGRTVPMAGAIDQAHRDMIGSGLVSENNPHGLSIDDLTGGTFDHADLFHVNGISTDADADQLLCSIDSVNDRILIENKGGFDNSFLIDGEAFTLVSGYAAGTQATIDFDVSPPLDSADYLIYLDSSAQQQKVKIAGYTPADAVDFDVLWSANIEIVDIQNKTSGNGTITWDSSHKSLQYQAPGDAAGSLVIVFEDSSGNVNGYYKLYSGDTDNWIIVHCSGSLGGSNSSTFAISMNSTDQPPDSVLKLAVVTWNQTGDALSNLRDIREFNTADNRDQVREEHDGDGAHTVPLRNTLKIAVTNDALHAYALNSVAYFRASYAQAVSATASLSAIKAYANVSVAGSFGAPVSALYVSAASKAGAFVAGSTAVSAVAETAVFGSAQPGQSIGIYGVAPNTAIYGLAATATAIYGTAPNVAGFLTAATATALYAKAANLAGVFTADTATALSASALNTAGKFVAVTATGVHGTAPNTAICGVAAVSAGIYGSASVRGIYGTASNLAMYAYAQANSAGNNIIGIYGEASNPGDAASAIGVEGYVAASGATGVAGLAVSGIGVYGSASAAGVIGVKGYGAGATGILGTINLNGGTAVFADAGLSTRTWGLGIRGWVTWAVNTVAPTGATQQMAPIVVNGDTYYIMLYS